MLPRKLITENLPPKITGIIHVTLSEQSVQLTGVDEGDGWTVNAEGIKLQPTGNSAVWFQLTLQLILEPQQQLSLVGVQITQYPVNPEAELATIFLPASSNQVVLNLIDSIPRGGQNVTYGMLIGISEGSSTQWFYPSISFEPEVEPPRL